MKYIIVPAIALSISACSSTGNTTAKNDGYKCEQVKTLGSSIPKKRCTTAEQRRAIREDSQDALRNHQTKGVLSEAR
ncbi:hypothetical protein [Pseudoalteromonas viridis]|uniref:Lipoprotein n=1 Tax=Pseudoalteromonas viridis TaxID=339617 RepID=A0ABX7V7H1_9GAMM|nr:hypothetical protein [Pseudoalteromonas viridis]QTL35392.1 hypothetical protein J5X90_18085 [Pseudoalteromonas viridis]